MHIVCIRIERARLLFGHDPQHMCIAPCFPRSRASTMVHRTGREGTCFFIEIQLLPLFVMCMQLNRPAVELRILHPKH